MYSKRIVELEPSGTIALGNRVKTMIEQGVDVVSLTLGEPDFDTPRPVREAAKKGLDEGLTHYMPSLGTMELRKAIAKRVMEHNHLKVDHQNVMVLPAKMAIFMAVQALVDPGDEVIVPDPGWVSYCPIVTLAGGRSVPVAMMHGDGWTWDLEDIEKAMTKRTKAIILNTPSNPTGSMVPLDVQKGIADLAAERDITVISDEIYENLVYDEPHHSIGSLDGMMDRTITVSGFSKSYAMTGWRIGWMVASKETIGMVNKFQEHSLTCLPGFVQKAAVAALQTGDGYVEEMRREFKGRRDMLIPKLNEIDGVTCEVPKGAFYAFMRMDTGMSSARTAEALLNDAHVALTPGSAFGRMGEGYQRMSYAASRKNLEEGIARIAKFMKGLKR